MPRLDRPPAAAGTRWNPRSCSSPSCIQLAADPARQASHRTFHSPGLRL